MKLINKILGEGWTLPKQITLVAGLGLAIVLIFKFLGNIAGVIAFAALMVYFVSRLLSGGGAD